MHRTEVPGTGLPPRRTEVRRTEVHGTEVPPRRTEVRSTKVPHSTEVHSFVGLHRRRARVYRHHTKGWRRCVDARRNAETYNLT